MDAKHKAAIARYTSQHNGVPLNQRALLRPSPMVQKMLLARMASMSDAEQGSIKTMINAKTEGALRKLIPELGSLITKGVKNGR